MTTQTTVATDLDPLTGHPHLAHLVAPDYCCEDDVCDGHGSLCGGTFKDGATKAFEARIARAPVLALCGLALVPSRDPQTLTTCPRCLEEFGELTGCQDDSECGQG